MTIFNRFLNCSANEKMLLCLAVLLDGYDASEYLACDKSEGSFLSKMAKELAAIPTDVRAPFLGTILRQVNEELEPNQN